MNPALNSLGKLANERYPSLNSLGKPSNEHYPFINSHEIALHKFAVEQAMKKGERLANKYFGPGGKKGFRWGAKQYKRYRSVADKCEKFEQTLTSCNPIQKNHAPGCVLHCIVEIAENIRDNTHSCSKYEDCDYPDEATCNLDQPDYLAPNCANL